MADPFLGEIRIFAGNFAPRDWEFCEGQLLSVSQYPYLYQILGTIYGGNGVNTFALPDLRGRAPVHAGAGVGLTPRMIGQHFGQAAVTLDINSLPAHTHSAKAVSSGTASTPSGDEAVWARPGGRPAPTPYKHQATDLVPLNPLAISAQGGSQPHNNMQPYVGINFIICTNGIYPPRS